MTQEEKNFYIHKHYAKSPTVRPKVTCWQLTYKPTGERIIHGQYSLCTWKRKQMAKFEMYKIEPFKN